MVFTTIDHVIEAAMSIYAEIIIRLSCIPKKCFWNGSRRHSTAECVARVQRQLRLEKCRASNVRQAHQRIVCSYNHAIKADPVAIDRDPPFFCIELSSCTLLKNM